MRNQKIYGVHASNGLMVSTNWEMVKRICQKYYRGEHYKSFDTFWEAEAFAILGYNRTHPHQQFWGVLGLNAPLFTSSMFQNVTPVPLVRFTDENNIWHQKIV